MHGGLPPVEPPLLPELDDEDELDEDDELELDEDDELLDPPLLVVVVLVMPPVELEVEPPLVEVEPPLVEVELPVLPVDELSLSILISTLVAPPPLMLPQKNPPKKPPPKPPKPPLEPPITIGWPPLAAMIGCCGSCGSGIGTMAYCSCSQHSRSTTRRMVRSRRGTVRSARRSLTYRGRSVLTILADR